MLSCLVRKSIRYQIILFSSLAQVRGGLEGAVSIAEVFCECCCSVNIGESSEFSESTLPAAVKNIIHLLRLLQQRIKDSLKVIVCVNTTTWIFLISRKL